SGRLNLSGGATFNFPAGLLNWSGGAIGNDTLNITGFLTLSGGSDKTLDSGGVLNNTGTIVQAAGRLILSNGTVQNQATGVYDFQTDNVITTNGGSNVFNNAGILKKSAGTGTSTLNAPLSNTGTVQTTTGTLTLNAGVAQLSGGTLSAGTWNALNGSTLDIPNLGSITSNNASVTLSGAGSVFAPINALATNTGTFNLLGGRTFTTAGAFDNQGTLSIGAAFDVSGTFTQAATGILNVNIGGTPASNLYGKLISAAAAMLDGTLNIGLYGGYGPSAGQTFSVLNFPSRTGSFAQTAGLSIAGLQYFQVATTSTAATLRAIADTADIQPALGAIPATGFVGQNLTIRFSVRNTETVPTFGSTWTDSVYLSTSAVLDSSAILLGQVVHNGQLAGRASYNATLTAQLPPITPGDYHVLVQVDSDGGIPDSGPDNNIQVSTTTIHTDMNALTSGVTTTVSVAAGQNLYYRLDEPAGLDIMLSALLGKLHQAEIYVRGGQLPDTGNYDLKAGDNGTLHLSIPILDTASSPYFVLVRGLDGAGGGVPVAISTRQMGFEIVSSSPTLVPNTGTTDITITGSHFSSNTTASLVFPGGAAIQPTSVDFSNSNMLIAHFDLTGAVPGNYDLHLQDSGQTAVSPAAVRISFAQANHSGTLTAGEHWFNGFVHYVTGTLVVPNGVTLTIDPGAIVKFAAFAGIEVDAGGTLIAQGTLTRNIIFTSISDDSHGGDTNGDGNATAPAAGNWGTIYVAGSASFDHAQVLYGGGNPAGSWSATASIRTAGGTLTFADSIMSQSFFDGILAWGGTVNVTNSIFTGIDRAISAHPGGVVTVTNCTFDNNRIALLSHGGNITINNCVVYNSSGAGIEFDFGGVPSVHYTDVFTTVPNAVNYANMADQTASNGNISADPKFRDPSMGDYRLGYLSPAIDAADGTLAPATDFAGVSRYDDPRTPNTGIAASNGTFADIGALEFVESAPSSLDLVVSSVSGPPQVSAGQTAVVQWTDVNNGTDVVRGSWHDDIELISQTTGGGVVLLDAGEVVSSATLSPGQGATFSAEITVPYGTEGVWRFQVHTNSRGEIFEGQNYGNNTTASVQTTMLVDPHLTAGTTAGGTFAVVNSGLLFKIHPTPGVDTLFTLGRADAGNTDIFISAGVAPTTTTFDTHSAGSGQTATFAIPAARDVDYYILLVPRTLSAGPVAFTLDSAIAQYSITGIGLSQGGNAGSVTVPILGAGLRPGATATLAASGVTLAATTVYFEDSTHIYATFDLTGLAAGTYDLKVTQNGVDRALPAAFNVVAGTPANLQMKILMPPLVRTGKEFTATVQYTNVGNQDVPAPFVLVTSPTGNQLRLSTNSTPGSSVQFLAISPDGPAGVLRPGETASVDLRVVGILGTNSLVPSWSGTDNTDTVDWAAIKATVTVENVPSNWNSIWSARIQSAGTHVGDYIRLLDTGATLRGTRSGVRSNSIQDNLNFLVLQALLDDASHISGNVYLNDTSHPLAGVIVQATSTTTGLSYSSMTFADGLV
ncbi:MAG: choice-of-anchor Q domain-containing protein, partial [Tepidisphaeraceae bacterium]